MDSQNHMPPYAHTEPPWDPVTREWVERTARKMGLEPECCDPDSIEDLSNLTDEASDPLQVILDADKDLEREPTPKPKKPRTDHGREPWQIRATVNHFNHIMKQRKMGIAKDQYTPLPPETRGLIVGIAMAAPGQADKKKSAHADHGNSFDIRNTLWYTENNYAKPNTRN